jgi:hypothetical protein
MYIYSFNLAYMMLLCMNYIQQYKLMLLLPLAIKKDREEKREIFLQHMLRNIKYIHTVCGVYDISPSLPSRFIIATG